jgi:sugar phosphate isomerase/epimerase
MTRRELIAAALASPALFGKTRIDKTRIGAITDEVGLSPQESLDFARQYNLRWIELRKVPGSKAGKEYAFLPEAELKEAAISFESNGLKVSLLKTAGEPKRPDAGKDDVHKACVAANILGCDKLRVFTGQRVADPKTVYQRIADEIGPLAEISATYKVHLLIENEASQNIGSSQELADIMRLLPTKWIGYSWDPQNAVPLNEKPFPEGYSVLPKDRMLNVQFSPGRLDWAGIVKALEKDNYKNQLGLETLMAAAHESMETMLRIVG